jgi:hypothetical protein
MIWLDPMNILPM